MIIVNGYIEAKTTTGGGMLHGVVQPVVESWGSKIPCNIRENRSDHQGQYIGGNFVRYAATLLIEPQSFTAKRIRITDNLGNDMGEYEVQSLRYLQAVEALELTVSNV